MTRKKTANLIIPGGYGDPKKQAANSPYDGSVPTKPAAPKPRLHSSNFVQTAARGPIKRTGTTVGGGGGAGAATTGSAQSIAQSPLYYDYRWSTPDKYYFPKNRVIANAIWREVYKRDAAIGIATDMYADLPWSNFDLVGIDDADIKKTYEDMFNELDIVSKLPEYSKDYLIVGEVILHALFNARKGIWERVISHNPDYISAEGIGLALDQPLLWLHPTPEIKRFINSPDKRVRNLQKILPKTIINAFRQNREVPLEELNTTFIARRNSSTDIRGTSLYTRVFRSIMYEDFVVNASLAVSQRLSTPLRIFKLGDPNTGWLPDEDDEAAFAEMLSMAESDPAAAIIMHHNVSVDLVGVADRALLISREWDFLERIKLLALGVAKSFLVGEASFAAAVAGLQTLLERLATLRNKFEREWIIKKLCNPVAEINQFYKRPESELSHRIRVKTPDEMEKIVPSIKWHKNLDPAQDVAILNIWNNLHEKGIISDRTLASGAGADLDVERKNQEEERSYLKEHPELFESSPDALGGPGAPKAPARKPKSPGGGPGGGPPPPVPLPGASKQAELNKSERDLYNEIEARLEEICDSNRNIEIDQALEIIRESKISNKTEMLEAFDKIERNLGTPGQNILSGA